MVNTRKRKYEIQINATDYDQMSLSNSFERDLYDMDLVCGQEIRNTEMLPKYTRKPKLFPTNGMLLVFIMLSVLVLYRYASVKRQDDISECGAKNPSLYNIYTKLEELTHQFKLLKTKCNSNLLSSMTVKQVEEIIEKALLLYDADKIGIIDYAMELSGGSILSTPDTYPFYRASIHILELFNSEYTSDPNTIIRTGTLPGQCYAFKGHTGRIRLQLMYIVNITAVTLEHTHRNLVIDPTSAPKDFRVYGLDSAKSSPGHDLGLFEYKLEENPVQTFEIKQKNLNSIGFKHVELQILSNYGNPDYTCIYRFRVHGNKFSPG